MAGKCSWCKYTVIDETAVYVKVGAAFTECCQGTCADKLLEHRALLKHAKEGAPQLTHLLHPPR